MTCETCGGKGSVLASMEMETCGTCLGDGISKMSKRDALGNPIIIGNRYGYSTDNSGWTRVVIGIAQKETKKGVTLKVVEARRGLYDDPPEPVGTRQTVNCKAMKLFPVA